MSDDSLAALIRGLEIRLMTRHVRNDPGAVAPLLAEEFVEFGSSGTVYDKATVLAKLKDDPRERPDVHDFHARAVAPGVVLATYRTIRPAVGAGVAREALRCSVWRASRAGWQLVFHQGTPVPQGEPNE